MTIAAKLYRLLFSYFTANRITAIYLLRKDSMPTGYLSELYVDKKLIGYALDTLPFTDTTVVVNRNRFTADEFTFKHVDGVVCLEPNSQLLSQLAPSVKVTVDSTRMAMEF